MATSADLVTLSSNFLTVNGSALRADVLEDSTSERTIVSPDELHRILLLGRVPILQGIELFYEQTVARNPGLTVVRPSIWTAHLGTTAQTDGRQTQVFTPKGYDNGGIISLQDELQDRFHGHWEAVHEAGFLPEVRRTSGKAAGGSWLLLRKPTLRDVMTNWFASYAPTNEAYDHLVDIVTQDDSVAERKKALMVVRAMGEKAIDATYDQSEHHSNAQIAQLLVMAALKETIGDISGSQEEAEDAATYAYHNPSTPDSATRAIENSLYSYYQN